MTKILFVCLVGLIGLLIHTSLAYEDSHLLQHVPDRLTNTWAVKVHPDIDPEWLAAFHGFTFKGHSGLNVSLPGEIYIFEFIDTLNPSRILEVEDKIFSLFPSLESSPYVLWAQRQVAKMRVKRSVQLPVSDPLYSSQWHISGDQSVSADRAWTTATGAGITIAVVDDGVKVNHPDIQPKYSAQGSWDFNQNDNDPTPASVDAHGTEVAGTAAAAENNVCGIGIAPDAGISGIRILGGDTTDLIEARGLSYNRNINQIYSNSWGPIDDGLRYEGPGDLAYAQLTSHEGRGGLGSIYVWAGGNGRANSDNCNYDGYANLPETIAIAAYDHNLQFSYYSEPCSALIAAAPSSGDSARRFSISTTNNGNGASQCTSRFGGTSAAAPVAAGVVALMLQVNPRLGWRDVQGLLVHNSVRFGNSDWALNEADLAYSHDFGFGRINASIVVKAASTWQNYGPQIRYQTPVIQRSQPLTPNVPSSFQFLIPIANRMVIEHIQLHVNLPHCGPGNVQIRLISPSGMVSKLQQYHNDIAVRDLIWTFMTVAHWDEIARDTWTVEITSKTAIIPSQISLTFLGHNS